MPGQRPRKVDCTGGSAAGGVAVVMAVSSGHEGGEEWASGAPGAGHALTWPVSAGDDGDEDEALMSHHQRRCDLAEDGGSVPGRDVAG
ncbi:hypothetical protein QYE76_037016 [Lolium multiflorum]|uniref:Uncharacterized protein n=1 Tax=Lolium multiflorum TaxID=4521 RepID=A0AAD8R239_LOLMU|nr:hypothetical protein QYE76_037016 [Lolium multiflorum]